MTKYGPAPRDKKYCSEHQKYCSEQRWRDKIEDTALLCVASPLLSMMGQVPG